MFMRQSSITGIPLNATPEVEGFSSAFVPVLNIESPKDFDYDSKLREVYWVEYYNKKREVG